jgi:hypothetical protein
MSQLIHNGKVFAADHSLSAILTGLVLAACVFAGASVFSFERPVILAPTVQADPASPSGPADWQTAQKYGRIDHSVLLNAPDAPDTIAAGASIAAYERPSQ